MTSESPRVVFDCMVFVQALANEVGPANACVKLVDEGKVVLFISPDVLAEVTEVLNRPKLRRKMPSLTPKRVDAFLQDVLGKAVFQTDVPKQFSYERDPKDEPYLNLAIAVGARFLVSRDKDLLDLMNENNPVGKAFREQFPSLFILGPAGLLAELNPKTQNATPKPQP